MGQKKVCYFYTPPRVCQDTSPRVFAPNLQPPRFYFETPFPNHNGGSWRQTIRPGLFSNVSNWTRANPIFALNSRLPRFYFERPSPITTVGSYIPGGTETESSASRTYPTHRHSDTLSCRGCQTRTPVQKALTGRRTPGGPAERVHRGTPRLFLSTEKTILSARQFRNH